MNKSDKLNEDVKIDICIDLKLRANHKFLSRFIGFKKAPDSLIDGIIQFTEGSIKPERHIDENNLIDVAELEKIRGGKIVEWEKDKGRYDVFLDKNLLQKFDDCWKNRGFRNRSEACRAIMYHQIMVWLKKYNANAEAALKRDANIIEGEKKLNEFLEKVKKFLIFNYELKVVWIPKANHHLDGEVVDKIIYIYSQDFEHSKFVVCHEYIEYLIKTLFTKPYVDIINEEIKAANNMYKEQEKAINSMAYMIYRLITGKDAISV